MLIDSSGALQDLLELLKYNPETLVLDILIKRNNQEDPGHVVPLKLCRIVFEDAKEEAQSRAESGSERQHLRSVSEVSDGLCQQMVEASSFGNQQMLLQTGSSDEYLRTTGCFGGGGGGSAMLMKSDTMKSDVSKN